MTPNEWYALKVIVEEKETYALGIANSTSFKKGSIYRSIGKLRERNLISYVSKDHEGKGPPRKVYKATKKGLKAIEHYKNLERMGLVSSLRMR